MVEDDIRDDAPLHQDSFVLEIEIKVLDHSWGVLLSSEIVSLSSLDGTSHGSYSLHDIGINCFVNLSDVGHQLLHVFVFGNYLQKNGKTDAHVNVVTSKHSI